MRAAQGRRFRGQQGLTAFHDALSSTLVDQRVEPTSPSRFSAQLEAVDFSGITLVDSRVTALRATRQPSGEADGALFLLTASRADGTIDHARGSEQVRPGRLVVIPGGEGFDVRYRFDARVSFIVIPPSIAQRRFADLGRGITSVELQSFGAALVAQVAGVRRSSHAVSPLAESAHGHLLDTVFLTLLDGIAHEIRPRDDLHLPALRSAAERLIDRDLRDPNLDANALARHLGVSRRTMHRAFEGSGDGVAGVIRHRRLDAAHRSLSDGSGKKVAEVAAEYGFGSASRFAANFRARFGYAPSEAQQSRVSQNGQPAGAERRDAELR